MLSRFSEHLAIRPRATTGEPESYSETQKKVEKKVDHGAIKPSIHAKSLPLIIGSILWVSIRTRPDISWAVARASSLATTDPNEAMIRVKHPLQYLRSTFSLALRSIGNGFTMIHSALAIFTDASFSPCAYAWWKCCFVQVDWKHHCMEEESPIHSGKEH
eukprot:1215461-Amphidinium_carterae.2